MNTCHYLKNKPTLQKDGWKHQKLVSELTQLLGSYIKSHSGNCEVIPAPFAVNLLADDKDWVEPNISVICDHSKLTPKGCVDAPDLIIEIVSPSSRKKSTLQSTNLKKILPLLYILSMLL